jgi:hypothetical protein
VTPNSETAHGATLTWGSHSAHTSYNVQIAQEQDTSVFYSDFEGNTIYQEFVNDGTYPWLVTSTKNHTSNGSYCIKSGNEGMNNTTSAIQYEISLPYASVISFYCWASCEYEHDYGVFYIDGVEQERFLNVTDWQYRSYELAAGTHTLKWAYAKDGSSFNNDDCFYVDDISIRGYSMGEWNSLTTVAGSPYTINTLQPSTTYQARVSAYCGNEESLESSNIVRFTTTEECAAPHDIVISEVFFNGCRFSFMPGAADQTEWAYIVTETPTPPTYATGSATITQNIPIQRDDIISPNQTYYLWVAYEC